MPTTDAGGGSRRLLQVMHLLKDMNIELVSAPRGDRISDRGKKKIEARVQKYRTGKITPGGDLWAARQSRHIFRLKEISREWTLSLPDIPEFQFSLMDDPFYFAPLAESFFRSGKSSAAVCHNIESLLFSHLPSKQRKRLFRREIDLLSRFRPIVTISREDTLLLHHFGLPAVYLPYYPPPLIEDQLNSIRKARMKTPKSGFLLLGNASNLATRQGMEKVIRFWQSQPENKTYGSLTVAGFRTETLSCAGQKNRRLRFLGPLSAQKLADELIRTRGVICYQESGTGALTRICEMLLAGVPVLANSHAARSYYNLSGVLELRHLEDLPDALEFLKSEDFAVPEPCPPDHGLLISSLREAAGI
jgi:hypothetical protein